jgi:uncharacterized membrane protein
MLEDLIARSSLPNLHPAVVHFPIALAVTASGLDLAATVLRKRRWLDHAGALLWALATAGIWAAWWTGEQAQKMMWHYEGAAQAALADHESLGLMAALVLTAVLGIRLVAAWLSAGDARTPLGPVRWAALGAGLGAIVLIMVTADHGGALVYEHGVGVGDSMIQEELEL